MKVQILGSSGGVAQGQMATSYLVDEKLLIDAGSVASALSVEEQAKIRHIFISHAHLDHIKGLAFLCDNCFGMNEWPFEVYCNEYVRNALLAHLFNDVIWPNFTQIPSAKGPTIRFNIISSEQSFQIDEYRIIPVAVNHPGNSLGLILEKENSSVVFTQDTGPTERIWKVAHGEQKNLKAIFTETSFPNELAELAKRSCHHTPETLSREVSKMPEGIPIFLGHLKPAFAQRLEGEIKAIGNDRISILSGSCEFKF